MLQVTRSLFWVLLFPLSVLWAFASRVRVRFLLPRGAYRSSIQTICVGNLHSGGSGKTPVLLALSELFKEKKPVLLCRGYKGAGNLPPVTCLDRNHLDGPHYYGDEPWMLSQRSSHPIYVGADRSAVVKEIERARAGGLILLDDGFQHLRLHRDINLLLINTVNSPEESYCLPLGDLREPLSAIRRADAILYTGNPSSAHQEKWCALLAKMGIVAPQFSLAPRVEGLWNGKEIFTEIPPRAWQAFCGIASPSRFVSMVEEHLGGKLLRAFPDHHPYRKAELEKLIGLKRKIPNSEFVTTEKDWFKVQPMLEELGESTYALRIRYEIPDDLVEWLRLKIDL